MKKNLNDNNLKTSLIPSVWKKNEQTGNSPTMFLLVQEYCKLSKLLEPSERDIERISAILELAQYDSELNCLINEADHLIAYELGFSEEYQTNFMVSKQSK